VFGPEGFQSYKEFAKQTTQKTEEQIIQSYISWMERKSEAKNQNWMTWIKERTENAVKGVGELFK